MLAVSMSSPVAHYSAVQRRPKLSLQTSELPITYGTSSRGLLTVATPAAAVTPTTLNTFNNTFDLTHRPSPTSAIASPSALRVASGQDQLSRSQSPRPKPLDAAYTVSLPYGVRSILKNTPFPRATNNPVSASPRSSTRRVFFPAPKEVVFKNAIEEEIVTKIYTARHSDLFQPDEMEEDDDDEVANDLLPQGVTMSSELSEHGSSVSISSSTQQQISCNTLKFNNSTDELSGRIDTDSVQVSTPASTKKRRRWEWTLAPPSQPHTTAAPETSQASEVNSESEPQENESASNLESERTTSQSSNPSRQDPAIFDDRTSESALPHPNLHSTTSESKKSALSSLTKLTVTLPLPQSQAQKQSQRRAGSLDSSPSRKRKAECLDASVTGASDSSEDEQSNTEVESDNTSDSNADAGQIGVKRRERAATL